MSFGEAGLRNLSTLLIIQYRNIKNGIVAYISPSKLCLDPSWNTAEINLVATSQNFCSCFIHSLSTEDDGSSSLEMVDVGNVILENTDFVYLEGEDVNTVWNGMMWYRAMIAM